MECVEDVELKRMQDKEDFWDAQQNHQCVGCGEYDEVLWPSGYCPECAAKRKAQFTCLRCHKTKPMLAFGPGGIRCLTCEEEMAKQDQAVDEHMTIFEDILDRREGDVRGLES